MIVSTYIASHRIDYTSQVDYLHLNVGTGSHLHRNTQDFQHCDF